jgi:HSP20 family protein
MYWIEHRKNWSPFDELRSLQREVNRLFDGAETAAAISRYPAVNIWGNNEKVVVTAELPGVDPNDLEINVVNNQLTIQGERKGDKPADEAVCHRAERGTGKFVRTIRLPYPVESDQVEATYKQGMLTINLPRQEATKPQRIEIKAA